MNTDTPTAISVIPSEVEESRGESFKVFPWDPSAALRSAQDDHRNQLQLL
jgi:hypothetical protein